MANKGYNREHTEFGGGPHTPGRMPDDTPKVLTAAEEAQVQRVLGFQPDLKKIPRVDEITTMDGRGQFVTTVGPNPGDTALIALIKKRTNGYSDGLRARDGAEITNEA